MGPLLSLPPPRSPLSVFSGWLHVERSVSKTHTSLNRVVSSWKPPKIRIFVPSRTVAEWCHRAAGTAPFVSTFTHDTVLLSGRQLYKSCDDDGCGSASPGCRFSTPHPPNT